MKKRLANVLAWAVWLNPLFWIVLIWSEGGPAPGYERQILFFFTLYTLGSACVIWVGLYILTGSPRILPWKQVSDDD